MFPPTKEDLTHSGEYSEENPNPGDNLPTSPQTRPRAPSEVQTEDTSPVFEPNAGLATATNDAESVATVQLTTKRKADDSGDESSEDGRNKNAKTFKKSSANATPLGNGVNGKLDTERREAADVGIDNHAS